MTARRQGEGNEERAIYIISVAAELAGVHPQTLRVYERKGLVTPSRTQGNTRRYSELDIQRLQRIQELTNEGINLAGVLRIMKLEREIARLKAGNDRAARQIIARERQIEELLHARDSMAMLPARDVRRVRRALKTDAIDEATQRRRFPAPPGTP
jgi:MerR family transcriptional regulator/heat shock protein HspR